MKLLLHMCCAPCSVYPVSVLKGEGMDLHGLFFNPNIHPEEEYLKRKENVEIFSRAENIPVELWDDMRQEVWENYKGSDEDRCNMCYSIRMDKTASIAKEKGFDAFSTTLLVSPYQKHELIKEIGERLAKKYGIDFYYKDFRPGFRQGQQQAREMGLYRQKFCGCIVSFIESKNRGK
jgi:predicted adenine nucleotide alpha hydrolase (AANH) superfamily ATPase